MQRRPLPVNARVSALQRISRPPSAAPHRLLRLLPSNVVQRSYAQRQPQAETTAHGTTDPVHDAASSTVVPSSAPQRRPTAHSKKSVEETYKKMSQREHILLRPESYVGSTERNISRQYVMEKGRMVEQEVSFVPALYKIFDEILVNAADNVQRDRSTSEIRVTLDDTKGVLSVWNNGKGVPIKKHSTEGVYVPEMVFGQLLTGSNFDDAELKVTGGRNGFGAKLANIFSKRFRVETVDSSAGIKYVQEWRDNMTVRGEPVLTSCSADERSDYTLVEFEPDTVRLGVASVAEGDLLRVLTRRVHDVAACNEQVAVHLNGTRLPSSFADYVRLFGVDGSLVERVNERWEVGISVAPSDAGFSHVSFVNSIATTRGGTHINYISDQIVKHLVERLNRTVKDINAQPYMVRNQLFLFVNCLIENPAFDSQTKETLTTKPSAFGSRCILSNSFLKQLEESTGIMQRVINSVRAKQHAELLDKTSTGRPRARLLSIAKLEDANEAGGSRAAECTLIVTEGDSAKALAVAGLSELGRDLFGVFPLRGKLLNARDATFEQLRDNVELNNIIAILGLSYDRKYETAEELATLRYGKVMLMTDQDVDGSHIKGLFINFIHKFWPALLEKQSFMEEFITPIVKATRGKAEVRSFFTLPEYEAWKKVQGEAVSKWKVKYYKGLGTSTAAEAKEYFKDLKRHRIVFEWAGGDDADINMAFSKTAADARKAWLLGHVEGTHVDHTSGRLSFKDFIHKELVLFSRYDTLRCIPSAIDGLKPGQRKVLYGCFRRNLTSEVKVAQLAGYVAEHAGYHHGEAALHSTIVGMAQDFVGANNLPLLAPVGQFGTRLAGGHDAASARYIFTHLAAHTRLVFDERDDPLLRYLDDDGFTIEPEFYVPVIPLVVVNGADGLGTGWSTQVPPYNPLDVIANLQRKLRGEPMQEMVPYWEGFTGQVDKASDTQVLTTGRMAEVAPGTLSITELPVGRWTNDYKTMLAALSQSHGRHRALVRDFREYHTNDSVHFRVMLAEAAKNKDRSTLEKMLKLSHSFSMNNMHLFGADGLIKKFKSPLEIMEDHFKVRMHFYEKRKDLLLSSLNADVLKLREQHRFSDLVTSGKLSLFNVKKDALLAQLESLGFVPLSGSFEHLLGTPLWGLTAERIARLSTEREKREIEQHTLSQRSPAALWEADLEALQGQLTKTRTERAKRASAEAEAAAKAAANAPTTGSAKGKGKSKRTSTPKKDASD